MAASTHQPAMRAFTVIKREGQDDFWLPIGAAFAHQSGDGFNVRSVEVTSPCRSRKNKRLSFNCGVMAQNEVG